MAKAAPWIKTDAEVRKRGEQTGLDTLVVHAVNDVDQPLGPFKGLVAQPTHKSTAWGVRPQG